MPHACNYEQPTRSNNEPASITRRPCQHDLVQRRKCRCTEVGSDHDADTVDCQELQRFRFETLFCCRSLETASEMFQQASDIRSDIRCINHLKEA